LSDRHSTYPMIHFFSDDGVSKVVPYKNGTLGESNVNNVTS